MKQQELRLEWKTTSHWPLPLVEAELRRQLPCYQRQYPTRMVHNIYFDTPDYQLYQAHRDGLPKRRKFRLRWYDQEGPPTLEIKHREGDYGWKQRFPVPFLSTADPQPYALSSKIQKALATEERALFRSLGPVVRIRYERQYFHIPGSGVRLTIDQDLHYALPQSRHWRGLAGLVVIECKIPIEETFLRKLPFPQIRFSKYVLALSALGGVAY